MSNEALKPNPQVKTALEVLNKSETDDKVIQIAVSENITLLLTKRGRIFVTPTNNVGGVWAQWIEVILPEL